MAFLSSGPAIYNTMQHKGVLASWVKEDYNSLFAPLMNMGYQWDANTERLIIPSAPGARKLIYTTPWCHAKGTPRKHCGLDHHVTFNNFHIIHPRCLSCWKIVVTPDNFKQLCQLEIMEKNMNVASKCGIEMRDYTPKHYGGYFYTHSLEEGRERYEQVRTAVNNSIDDGKDIDVILKRGCTEYELIKGPSVFWTNTRDEEEMLELIDAFVDMPRANNRQSEMVKTSVRLKWALWAHANGDMSYKELNNGESLFPDYIKYHEGDIKDLLHDLEVGAQYTIDLDEKVKAQAQANELKSALDEVPEEAKGDHDELT